MQRFQIDRRPLPPLPGTLIDQRATRRFIPLPLLGPLFPYRPVFRIVRPRLKGPQMLVGSRTVGIEAMVFRSARAGQFALRQHQPRRAPLLQILQLLSPQDLSLAFRPSNLFYPLTQVFGTSIRYIDIWAEDYSHLSLPSSLVPRGPKSEKLRLGIRKRHNHLRPFSSIFLKSLGILRIA